ncbi:MAG: 50S ribosomal protein L35 [Patescibacteria group bacterium]|nr:50S ribosomal protein L35 [Patescibacteria group bacterium]
MKTQKAIAKRFKVTKTGKVLKRVCGQDHFNSREPGKVTRMKRRDRKMEGVIANTIKSVILK